MTKTEEIKHFVRQKISGIEMMAEQSDGKATLAQLRRGIGTTPGSQPELLGIILMDMPADFLSRDGDPTKEEWACYIALTLYACHQQGLDPLSNAMNTKEYISVGKAMADYVAHIGSDDENVSLRIGKRLQRITTSKDMKELSHHLRTAIELFRSEEIAINYPLLANDLYSFQFTDGRKRVVLRWAQDYYSNLRSGGKKDNE
ncbi:MAG: type I-E CRISPR-associated protein Cse2/CasB [Anaerovoracaceae bacterium]